MLYIYPLKDFPLTPSTRFIQDRRKFWIQCFPLQGSNSSSTPLHLDSDHSCRGILGTPWILCNGPQTLCLSECLPCPTVKVSIGRHNLFSSNFHTTGQKEEALEQTKMIFEIVIEEVYIYISMYSVYMIHRVCIYYT